VSPRGAAVAYTNTSTRQLMRDLQLELEPLVREKVKIMRFDTPSYLIEHCPGGPEPLIQVVVANRGRSEDTLRHLDELIEIVKARYARLMEHPADPRGSESNNA
jgi:hypothetical protein